MIYHMGWQVAAMVCVARFGSMPESIPQDILDLPKEKLEQLLSKLDSEVEVRTGEDPVHWFSWHDQQRWLFDAPGMVDGDVRVVIALGGNRAGKTAYAKGEMARLVRRDSAINEQLMSFDPITGQPRPKEEHEPLTIWIVPPTFEKARSDWISPSDGMGIRYWLGDRFIHETKSPDQILYARPPGVPLPKEPVANLTTDEKDNYLKRCDRIVIKAQKQDLHTFESSEVDAVFFDEEPPGDHGHAIVNSCLMRVGTSNGVLIFSFTPLQGLSWSYKRFYKPLVIEGRAGTYGDRRWIHVPKKGRRVVIAQMGTYDNPRAKTYAEEIEADPEMSEAEKMARLRGQYGYVEGALLPALAGMDLTAPTGDHEPYVIDRLPGDAADGDYRTASGRVPGKVESWYMVMDPNKSFGALLSCVDQDGNLYFVCSHLKENWPDRKHAERFKAMEKKWARGDVQYWHDPGSAGAHSSTNLADNGIYSSAIEKGGGSVSMSIKRLRGLTYIDPDHRHPITGELGAPRVYFYRPGLVETIEEGGMVIKGSRLTEQLSQARQSDKETAAPDTPHKDHKNKLDLFDCARYTAMIAIPRTSSDDDRETAPDHTRLPRDRELDRGRDRPDLTERTFFAPQYGTDLY